MKKIISTIGILLIAICVFAQNSPTLIDFEQPGNYNPGGCTVPYSQPEAVLLDNNYFQCAYDITFHMGSLGGVPPTVAEVGAPRVAWGSGTGYTYNNPNCTQGSSVTEDKPTNNKDVGCWFITDDANGPGQNPAPLYVDYGPSLECTEASGYLMDVDGTGNVQEGWRVTAHGVGGNTHTVYVLSLQYNLYQTPPSPQVNTVAGDGEASYWHVNLGTDPIDYIVFEYIGHPSRGVGLAFDEFAICSAQEDPVPARGCCDVEDDLLINGSFESGNVGFTTGGYTYQGLFAPGSVQEGQYSVVTSQQAATISSCWQLSDHTYCNGEDGRFMVVNGRTHNPMYSIVYEQRDIEVDESKEYRFCMYYQHLPQCSFDVFSPDNLQVLISGADLIEEDCEDDEEHCGWTKISYTVIPTSNMLSLQVLLDESGIGDGNDVAFDDFSLVEKQPTPSSYCAFNFSSSTLPSGDKNITVTAVNPLPPDFDAVWKVYKLDCNTGNIISGPVTYSGSSSTNFPGYNGTTPGTFYQNECYRITREVTNCCHTPCEDVFDFMYGQSLLLMANVTTDEPVEANQWYYTKDGEHWFKFGTALTNVEIFPNPGDGVVTISSNRSLEGAHINVHSSDGRVILEQQITTTKGSVNISTLPNGVYSFEIIEADGNITHKKYIKK